MVLIAIERGKISEKGAPSMDALSRLSSVSVAMPACTREKTVTMMYDWRIICGKLSMSTSAMMRVALYAGMNWRIWSVRQGTTGSSPNGSRNMRQSSPSMPKGKPRTTKKRYSPDSGPKVSWRYGSTRSHTTKNWRNKKTDAMLAQAH